MAINIIKRYSNTITNKEDLDYIFNLTEDDCCKLSVCTEMFGLFNNKRRFHPYDIITVPPGVFGPEGKKNKNAFITTIGIFMMNRLFIEKDLLDLIGYINQPFTKKIYKKINGKLGYAVIEDKIPLDVMKSFILKSQKVMGLSSIFTTSFTESMLSVSTALDSKRKELFTKYKDGLDNGDPVIAEKVEKELLDESKKILANDPGMDMIDSGSKISWGNNFKKIFVFNGANKTTDPSRGHGGFTIIKSNFIDGCTKEEFSDFADSMVGGPYARSKNKMRYVHICKVCA